MANIRNGEPNRVAPIELSYVKGHGTGNDFVLFADPAGEIDLTTAEYASLCDRHFGIGADGVIRAVPCRSIPEGQAILQEEPGAEWFMDYRNADGSIAEMCGNGIRVLAAFLIDQALAEVPRGGTLAVGTRAGVRDIQASPTGFQVDMGRWQFTQSEIKVTLPLSGRQTAFDGVGIAVGNPHVVVALTDASQLAELDLSRQPSISPAPENGANVEFIVLDNPAVKDGVGRVEMRVYERGVGETLSCGTGVVATALAARIHLGPDAPNQWQVTVPGGRLAVRMFPTEEGEHVSLAGPAVLVSRGVITLPITI